jgi:uncharacterized protein YecE (DUF72 family)
VEIDATYYALLPPEHALLLAQRTPPGFLFGVKAFALFTGHPADAARLPRSVRSLLPADLAAARRLTARDLPEDAASACWELFEAFLKPLEAHGRLGHVLFQFPRWTAYSPGVLRYLEHVRCRLENRPVAAEWRHRSWVQGAARREMARALQDLQMAYVVPDCPPVDWAPPPVVEITAPWSVVRLHGRNAAGWERGAGLEAAYDYLYTEEELREWAGRARSIAAGVDRLFLMFNNCTRGQAAVNAARMVQLLLGDGG